jgi:ADP-ribosylglycohydrolase
VDSVIETILVSANERIRPELKRALELSEDPRSMVDEFYKIYNGKGISYAHSWANEVVSKAVAVFRAVNGNPAEAIKTSVNFGRDTDCLAAISGGLSGALSGSGSLRPEWIEQVDAAAKVNIYTNSQRTLEQTAEGLFEALMRRAKRAETWAESIAY